jgi:glycosyltransferase involved in cell wall biosynthesis
MAGEKVDVSVVVPACDEAENLVELAGRILFVDDGSEDGSLEVLRGLAKADLRIRYISFTRNFGHQNALKAGFDAARGACVITMDADLQHPPELLLLLVDRWRSGCDVVSTIRADDPGLPRPKLLASRFFYSLVNSLSEVPIRKGAADFRLLSRPVVDTLRFMPERDPFFRGLVPWTGFRQEEIPYTPAPRLHGATKYGFGKMLKLALDGITSFSVKPLRLTTALGAVISLFAFLYAVYALAMRLFTDSTAAGWTSILISVLFIGGIQLLSLGIIGEYLGKLFMESKGRPHYIVRESGGGSGEESK